MSTKKLLPTPSATERSGINPKTGKGAGLSKTVKKLWRTPDAGTHENVASPTKSLMNGTARKDQQIRLVDQVLNPALMDLPQRGSPQLPLLQGDSLATCVSRLRNLCSARFGFMVAAILVQFLGVAHNEDSISSVRGVDGTSWNKKRLDFIALTFQVRYTIVEPHIEEAKHIFCNDPIGPDF